MNVKQARVNAAVVQVNITCDGCNENGMRSMYRTLRIAKSALTIQKKEESKYFSANCECRTNACNKIKLWNLFKREVIEGKLLAIR